jgi:crotonobetainyl-CoA:carnitine CoA-transferase CaiB-like acyl-CoA transferase
LNQPDVSATHGALDGLRVLDLSRVFAGPYCTQMLADHGARVIKVEAPSGDDTRSWGPPFADDGMSAYYMGLNRNKKNVSLDLRTPQGVALLEKLLAETDVMVENFKAGTLSRWGLDDEVLRQRYPRLVHCRISGFGDDGPLGGLPGYDAMLQAYCGLMSVNGEADGPPLRVGVPIVDLVTGIMSFAGILLAIQERQISGLGQKVSCSLFDVAISLLHPHSASWLVSGVTPVRTGSAHPTVAPYDVFEASDGPVFVGCGSDTQFRALTKALGVARLGVDARFQTNADRITNLDLLRPLLADALKGMTAREATVAALAHGVPASEVNTVDQVLSSEQAIHSGMVQQLGRYRGIGIPIKLGRTPGSVRSPPGTLGQDNDEVFAPFPEASVPDR